VRVEPYRGGHVCRDVAIVPGNNLRADAEHREFTERFCDVALGRIEEEQEAGERHPVLVVVRILRFRQCSLGGHGEDAIAVGALSSVIVETALA